MIREGVPSRQISDWLKKQKKYPEKISHAAIHRYRTGPYNVNAKAAEQYRENQSKELFDKAVKKTVSDIEFLDGIIDTANSIGLNVDDDRNITPLDIAKLGVQAVKAKHEIIKDEPDNVINVNVGVENNVQVPKDPSLRARGRDFIQSLRTGQVESSDSSNDNE